MSIVAITLAGRNFKLACSEESKPHIEMLASKLDDELKIMAETNPSASFEMLLVMMALNLMDDKHSQNKALGGEILAQAEQDHQKQMQFLLQELNNLNARF